MKSVMGIVLSFFILSITSGQDSLSEKKVKLSSISQFGLLVGESGESATIQLINGIKKDKWFAGFGAGIDFYVERGVPLFIDIRRDLTNGKNALFLYADGGIYFPWLNFIQKEQRPNSTMAPGAYYDVGLGWKLRGKNKRGFLLSAGYTAKQDKGKTTFPTWNPTITGFENTAGYYNYKYRRLVLKVGIQL